MAQHTLEHKQSKREMSPLLKGVGILATVLAVDFGVGLAFETEAPLPVINTIGEFAVLFSGQ